MKISSIQHKANLAEKARLESIGFEFEIGYLGYTVKRNGDWVHGYSEEKVPPPDVWEEKMRKHLVFVLAIAQDEEENPRNLKPLIFKRPENRNWVHKCTRGEREKLNELKFKMNYAIMFGKKANSKLIFWQGELERCNKLEVEATAEYYSLKNKLQEESVKKCLDGGNKIDYPVDTVVKLNKP